MILPAYVQVGTIEVPTTDLQDSPTFFICFGINKDWFSVFDGWLSMLGDSTFWHGDESRIDAVTEQIVTLLNTWQDWNPCLCQFIIPYQPNNVSGLLTAINEKCGSVFSCPTWCELLPDAIGPDGIDPIPLIGALVSCGYVQLAAAIAAAFGL